MYELADRRLAAAGLGWYEISNWARPGQRSRHNLAYWQRRPYEAVGPGAHAFDGATRRWNAARLDGYIAALQPPAGGAPSLPPGGTEATNVDLAAFEAAMLALRTSDGWLPMGSDALGTASLDRRLADPLAAGLLERDPAGRLALTLRGRLLSNEVFSRLLPAPG
jgi:oxygen-independent coproporphyrinogen-3 oxidase